MSATPPDDSVRVLFVTWDGPGSTYLASLFLPIFEALGHRGFQFHVLQFGWSFAEETGRIADTCSRAGVPYRSAGVWRRPVSAGSVATALAGRSAVQSCVAEWGIDLVMPRSYLPALAAIGARCGLPVLLDADGLPNDERVEFAGESKRSVAQRLLSTIERLAVRSAHAVTVRTARAAEILAERAAVDESKFVTVRNARDASQFRPLSSAERDEVRADLGIERDSPVIAYVGNSLTGKYLGDAIAEFAGFVLDRRSDARLLLVLTDPKIADPLLRSDPRLVPATIVRACPSSEVARLVGSADLGLSLIRQAPSMQAASAIKSGEYLLCGVPLLATSGVGGIETWLTPDAGRVLEDTSAAELDVAAAWFINDVLPRRQQFAEAARRIGEEQYGLEGALADYERALRLAIDRHAGTEQ